MGLLTDLLKVAVDVVALPVAAAADIVTAGQAGLTKKAAEKLSEDTEELLTGGDGNIV